MFHLIYLDDSLSWSLVKVSKTTRLTTENRAQYLKPTAILMKHITVQHSAAFPTSRVTYGRLDFVNKYKFCYTWKKRRGKLWRVNELLNTIRQAIMCSQNNIITSESLSTLTRMCFVTRPIYYSYNGNNSLCIM